MLVIVYVPGGNNTIPPALGVRASKLDWIAEVSSVPQLTFADDTLVDAGVFNVTCIGLIKTPINVES